MRWSPFSSCFTSRLASSPWSCLPPTSTSTSPFHLQLLLLLSSAFSNQGVWICTITEYRKLLILVTFICYLLNLLVAFCLLVGFIHQVLFWHPAPPKYIYWVLLIRMLTLEHSSGSGGGDPEWERRKKCNEAAGTTNYTCNENHLMRKGGLPPCVQIGTSEDNVWSCDFCNELASTINSLRMQRVWFWARSQQWSWDAAKWLHVWCLNTLRNCNPFQPIRTWSRPCLHFISTFF